MDCALIKGLSTPKSNKKFGWFCESRIVRHSVFTNIKSNLSNYKKSYEKIFTCDSELINLDPDFFIFNFAGSNLPWTPREDFDIHKKSKMTSFLCSNNKMTEGHRYRVSCATKLKSKVDVYGNVFGGTTIGTKQGHYHHKPKTEAMQDYYYSIAMENIKYNSYFTEKITDCFANGVIPIYFGTDEIGKYFDLDGIIVFTEKFDPSTLSADLYQSKINSIKTNFEIACNMESADDMLYRKIKTII